MVSFPSPPSPSAGSAAAPAYASAPRRGGLLVAVAGIVVVAAIAAAAIFMTGGRAPAPAPSVGATGAPDGVARDGADARKAALEEAARGVLQPQAGALPASESTTAAGAQAAGESKAAPEP